jgi:hypothetical protein
MSTLSVTITESLPNYNGAVNDLVLTNSVDIAGVDDIYHRVITVPAGVPVTVASFHANTGTVDSGLAVQNVKYIRVTNLEDSAPAILSLQVDPEEDGTAATDQASIRLEAGKSFIMGAPHEGIEVDSTSATASVDLSTLFDLQSIIVDPLAVAVKVEVFIASTVA